MDLFETVKSIEAKDDYRAWREKNPDAYLTSAFAMFSDEAKEWLVNYFNETNSKITSFSLEKHLTEEPFTTERVVPRLTLGDVKVDSEKALLTAYDIMYEKHGNENSQRTIMVLQSFDNVVLWNITFITPSMRVVNIRISAKNGRVITHNSSAITDFMQPDKSQF